MAIVKISRTPKRFPINHFGQFDDLHGYLVCI